MEGKHHISHEEARKRANDWVDAWNRKDLEAILTHYAEEIEICSPLVVKRYGIEDGKIKGKEKVREYFSIGLQNPDLKFEFVDVLVGVNAISVLYKRETGALVCDCSEINDKYLITRMTACYGQPGK